jgi:hypothetical protein
MEHSDHWIKNRWHGKQRSFQTMKHSHLWTWPDAMENSEIFKFRSLDQSAQLQWNVWLIIVDHGKDQSGHPGITTTQYYGVWMQEAWCRSTFVSSSCCDWSNGKYSTLYQ